MATSFENPKIKKDYGMETYIKDGISNVVRHRYVTYGQKTKVLDNDTTNLLGSKMNHPLLYEGITFVESVESKDFFETSDYVLLVTLLRLL